MTEISKTLIKNGVSGLIDQEENYFKENICHALSFKLNSIMEDAYKDISSILLLRNETTPNSEKLIEFVDFINNFKPGKHTFKNNSVINITESEIRAIKNLFEQLNTKNRINMVNQIFEDAQTFKNHIDFYNKSKGLFG